MIKQESILPNVILNLFFFFYIVEMFYVMRFFLEWRGYIIEHSFHLVGCSFPSSSFLEDLLQS